MKIFNFKAVKAVTPPPIPGRCLIFQAFDKFFKNNYNSSIMNYKSAFTLAEVLITLGIIGVVAAMTIPTLVAKYQEQVTITKVVKIYGILSNAYKLYVAENNASPLYADDIINNLKIHKICENSNEGCADNEYKTINGGKIAFGKDDSWLTSVNYAVLQTGEVLRYNAQYKLSCTSNNGSGILKNTCGEIAVDINGNQGPNIGGEDVFYFYITSNGMYPFGSKDETRYPFTNCRTNGVACSAWVIENRNLDYTKCDDLSWDGKHSCKE